MALFLNEPIKIFSINAKFPPLVNKESMLVGDYDLKMPGLVFCPTVVVSAELVNRQDDLKNSSKPESFSILFLVEQMV